MLSKYQKTTALVLLFALQCNALAKADSERSLTDYALTDDTVSSNARTEKVQRLSLGQAIQIAQENDPWLHGSKLKQSAVKANSIALGSLPDPRVSIGLLNLPSDTWDMDQEGMTQLKIGVSQMFPRGNELAIKQSQLQTESTQFPLLRQDRKAKLKTKISQLWLDAYLAQQTIKLINNDKSLFEKMVDITRASYSSNYGKTRQQDVIRSQLELLQLDDRLSVEQQNLDVAIAQLNEWLHIYNKQTHYDIDFDSQPAAFLVSNDLPNIRFNGPLTIKTGHYSRNDLAHAVASHPALLAIDVTRQVALKEVELANQQYEPQWGVNASYAYRDDMPSGDDRADLFSIGVSFDVPLFTENRQDKRVEATVAQAEVVKTEKLLLTKNMISNIEKEIKQLKHLTQRQALYQNQLLSQTHQQAEASLTAYTNDDGDFSEVVRARISEQNAKISALQIDINALKTITRLNYYFTQSNESSLTTLGEY